MDIVLFGIQGSGKGTQGKVIAEKYGMKIFETGAELRRLSHDNSPLGQKIKAIINAGYLVPNEVVMEIIHNFLKGISDSERVLFDGLPRSMEQKETFDALMAKEGRGFKGILIELSLEDATNRLLSRKICSKCKSVFPATYDKDECAKCGGELIKRADDNEEAIKTRLAAFANETIPVIEAYKSSEQMISVNGSGTIPEVTDSIITELDNLFA